MESGIYIIKNLVNGKVYVGSAKVFRIRWNRHLNDLRKGTHSSIKLQRAYNKYGIENFEFKKIEIVKYKYPDIVERENFYIKKLNSKKIGYNIADASFGDVITNHPNREDIINRMTKSMKDFASGLSKSEIKRRFSHPLNKNPNWKGGISVFYCSCGNKKSRAAITCHDCRERSGKNNPFFGKSHSKNTKNIISKTNKGRLPPNIKPIEIDGVKYTSANEASEKLNISSLTIRWRVMSKNKKFKNYKYAKQPKNKYNGKNKRKKRTS